MVLSTGLLVISEFMAANGSGLRDQDNEFSDWIEIHNPGETAVDSDRLVSDRHRRRLEGMAIPGDVDRQRRLPGRLRVPISTTRRRNVRRRWN